jgi:hypothetical protein
VIVNHGEYLECSRGLPKDHPFLYALFGGMYFGGGCGLLFAAGRIRRVRKPALTKAPAVD